MSLGFKTVVQKRRPVIYAVSVTTRLPDVQNWINYISFALEKQKFNIIKDSKIFSGPVENKNTKTYRSAKNQKEITVYSKINVLAQTI